MFNDSKTIPIKVAVRIRPLLPKEIEERSQFSIEKVPNTSEIVVNSVKTFEFDYVFGTNENQETIYCTTIVPLLEEFFKGYNVTLMAYGQTGSGKTFTIGTSYIRDYEISCEELGIIPRCINDIFEIIQASSCKYTVKVSFVELYNEKIIDLLSKKEKKDATVEIREDLKGGIKFIGASQIIVTSLKEAMKCLEEGSSNRITGATAMNDTSSRSHAIFCIHLTKIDCDSKEDVTISKLQFVDLAGSERVAKTKTKGERFKEGVYINKELLMLGTVISALGSSSNSYIPYRSSKLTRMLQDSLGGNSYTLMIACISPADVNITESLNTLRYACRAKKIENKPIINRDPIFEEVLQLRTKNKELILELAKYRDNILMSETSVKQDKKLHELEIENEQLKLLLSSTTEMSVGHSEKNIMTDETSQKMNELIEKLQYNCMEFSKFIHNSSHTEKIKENDYFQELIFCIEEIKKLHDNSYKSIKIGKFMEQDEIDEEIIQNSEDKMKNEKDIKNIIMKAQLAIKLNNLDSELAEKENLIYTYEMDTKKMENIDMDYVHHLEQHVEILQNELQTLQSVTKNQENENIKWIEKNKQIAELKKEIAEKQSIQAQRQKLDSQVILLRKEIITMKQERVKLFKQIKEEGERYRSLRLEKDKEIRHLQLLQRRYQVQQVRMENIFQKKEMAMKRKMEQATSANKRLKQALDSYNKRNDHHDFAGKITRCALMNDIELLTSYKRVQRAVETFIDQRKQLANKLQKIDDEQDFEKQKLIQELETCNAQISSLQNELVHVDYDAKSRSLQKALMQGIHGSWAMEYFLEKLVDLQDSLSERNEQLTIAQSVIQDLEQKQNEHQQANEHALLQAYKVEQKAQALLGDSTLKNLCSNTTFNVASNGPVSSGNYISDEILQCSLEHTLEDRKEMGEEKKHFDSHIQHDDNLLLVENELSYENAMGIINDSERILSSHKTPKRRTYLPQIPSFNLSHI